MTTNLLCEQNCEICPLADIKVESQLRDARNLSKLVGLIISPEILLSDFRESHSISLRLHAYSIVPGISELALTAGLELAFIQARGLCKK